MPAPFDPHTPTVDQTLTAQTSQYVLTPNEDVLDAMANVAPKAAQGRINSAAALRNPAYTRP